MADDFGYDYCKFDKLLKKTKKWLLQLDSKKRLNVIRELLKNPHYDESDVYILCLKEDQKPSEPNELIQIRFPMKEQKPIKPITEEANKVEKFGKRMGRKRPRDEDWEFSGEEEKKKRVNRKKRKKVKTVALPEKERDLPAEFKDKIRELNGCDAIMVMEKISPIILYSVSQSQRFLIGSLFLLLKKKRMADDFGYNYRKCDKLLRKTKEWLLQLDIKKRLNVVRELIKNPHYDESDVYILCLNEYQTPPDHNPPEPNELIEIRFLMKELKPIKPITEEANMVEKTEKRMGQKRRRDEDWEFGGEEEKKKEEEVNTVALPEKEPELPEEFKDKIRELNGCDAIMVMEKKLFATDVNTGNAHLSLPAREIDTRFLSEEEKIFLATRQDGNRISRIKSRIIVEGGMEHGICLSQWVSGKASVVYVLLSGWKDVVEDHKLREDNLVQLWSFRVEGKPWFALVRVGSRNGEEGLEEGVEVN